MEEEGSGAAQSVSAEPWEDAGHCEDVWDSPGGREPCRAMPCLHSTGLVAEVPVVQAPFLRCSVLFGRTVSPDVAILASVLRLVQELHS